MADGPPIVVSSMPVMARMESRSCSASSRRKAPVGTCEVRDASRAPSSGKATVSKPALETAQPVHPEPSGVGVDERPPAARVLMKGPAHSAFSAISHHRSEIG